MERSIGSHKGYDILDVNGVLTVHKDGISFIVDIDGSKLYKNRHMKKEERNVECAKQYINWREEACLSTS